MQRSPIRPHLQPHALRISNSGTLHRRPLEFREVGIAGVDKPVDTSQPSFYDEGMTSARKRHDSGGERRGKRTATPTPFTWTTTMLLVVTERPGIPVCTAAHVRPPGTVAIFHVGDRKKAKAFAKSYLPTRPDGVRVKIVEVKVTRELPE